MNKTLIILNIIFITLIYILAYINIDYSILPVLKNTQIEEFTGTIS